jgi:hypothetical protein
VQRHGQIDVEAEDLCICATENVEERGGERSCPAVSNGSRERWWVEEKETWGVGTRTDPDLECHRLIWHRMVGEYLGEKIGTNE